MGFGGVATSDVIQVREFEEADEAAVLALLQKAFGRWPEIEAVSATDFFQWKFRRCPFGQAMLRVAEVDGDVAGVAAYMPWRFRDGQGEVHALRGADLAVDHAHRGRGVSMAIRAAARFDEVFAFALVARRGENPRRAPVDGQGSPLPALALWQLRSVSRGPDRLRGMCGDRDLPPPWRRHGRARL